MIASAALGAPLIIGVALNSQSATSALIAPLSVLTSSPARTISAADLVASYSVVISSISAMNNAEQQTRKCIYDIEYNESPEEINEDGLAAINGCISAYNLTISQVSDIYGNAIKSKDWMRYKTILEDQRNQIIKSISSVRNALLDLEVAVKQRLPQQAIDENPPFSEEELLAAVNASHDLLGLEKRHQLSAA